MYFKGDSYRNSWQLVRILLATDLAIGDSYRNSWQLVGILLATDLAISIFHSWRFVALCCFDL